MYNNITSAVKWEDDINEPFQERQGIRQGGSSSADIYKCGKNKLLFQLENCPGNHIGHMPVGAIMVADDLLLNSKSPAELQFNIDIAESDARKERYRFNADKTKILNINAQRDISFTLYGKHLSNSLGEPHLGITRTAANTNRDTINNRVKSARRALYDLLGAGMSGLRNIGPVVALHGYTVYVEPILLYGLEATVPESKDIICLTKFHRHTLRRFLNVPNSTAVCALHILSGSLPIEATIHKRALRLFRSNLDADADTPPAIFTRDLVLRQLAVKDLESSSWTSYIKRLFLLCHLQGIPSFISKMP